jgi:hypothetical protein
LPILGTTVARITENAHAMIKSTVSSEPVNPGAVGKFGIFGRPKSEMPLRNTCKMGDLMNCYTSRGMK